MPLYTLQPGWIPNNFGPGWAYSPEEDAYYQLDVADGVRRTGAEIRNLDRPTAPPYQVRPWVPEPVQPIQPIQPFPIPVPMPIMLPDPGDPIGGDPVEINPTLPIGVNPAFPIVAAGGAVTVAASWLTRVLGPATSTAVIALFRQLAARGVAGRIAWNALPAWLRTVFTGLGITAGVDLIFDDDGPGGDTGIIPWPGAQGSVGGVTIIGSWEANGVKFYRLSDGKFAVQNKHGRWKIWRAPKPIVITRGGAGNLRTFVAADRALDRQAKRLKSALGRRTSPPRPRCATCGYVYCRCKKKAP